MTATQAKFSWYNADLKVKQLLILALDNWGNNELAEQYLNEALAKAGNNFDVLIGAYRFFFYRNKLEAALKIATQIMQIIQQQEKLPAEWEQLQPILNSSKDESAIRLYLNAYAATGLIYAKWGRFEEAKIITERVKKIDKKRESCATTVFEVLTNSSEEDE